MKVIFLDTIYSSALVNILAKCFDQFEDYQSFTAEIENFAFGTSGVYSDLLPKLGVSCEEITCNSLFLNQLANRGTKNVLSRFLYDLDRVARWKFLYKLFVKSKLFEGEILKKISVERPDIIHCQDIDFFSDNFYRAVKPFTKKLVGQIASPLPQNRKKLSHFDMIVSSFPHFVDFFRDNGVESEYLALAFDRRALSFSENAESKIDFSFVGGLGRHHKDWIQFLSDLNKRVDISLFGYGKHNLLMFPSLLLNHYGEVWGAEMYKTLARSKITFNRHLKHSERFANNMRLFEATGMGSLLLTDNKSNISDFFRINHEIIVYSSVEEAADVVRYFLDNPEEAESIARAGQQRTLSEHCYDHRMPELKRIYDCLFK